MKVHFGNNCPDSLAQAIVAGLERGLSPRALEPGEPNPKNYPSFEDYWEACEKYRKSPQ